MKKTLFQIAAALLSAVLLGLLWEPFRQNGGAWFALVPLLLLVRHVSVRRAFWLGSLAGFASWIIQLAWMLKLTDNGGPWPLVVPALLGLSAVLAVFIGLFAALAAAFRQRLPAETAGGFRRPVMRIALTLAVEPILWAGTECLRSNVFTGFAWNPLGLVCTDYLPLAQPAAVGGVALVSALVVAANGAVATILERFWGALTHTAPTDVRSRLLLSLESALPLAMLLAAFAWGLGRMRTYAAEPKTGEAVLVVERTSIPCVFSGVEPETVWEQGARTADILPFFRADVWLWPESAASGFAFPYHTAAKNHLRQLARKAKTPLLVGGLYEVSEDSWYNAAMLFTETGLDTAQVYGKRHLVPFGEYIPFDRTFPALQRLAPTGISNVPGEKVTAIRLPSGLTVGPLICFEDTVADMARQSVRDGARVLVNMSNDAWYTPSPEAAQHARQAVMRCIETGVPMARSTNGGLNTAIDAVGNTTVIEQIPTRLPLTAMPFASLYLIYGDLVFGGPCALFVLCALAFFLLCRKPAGDHEDQTRGKLRTSGNTRVAVTLVALLATGAAVAGNDLIPVAGMAMDDGNVNLAERTARTLLATLGISSEERAKAEEILIRADLSKGDWAAALARIEECPVLPAGRRLVLTLAARNGQKDFAGTLLAYEEAKLPTDDAWGVAALRLALQADLELGKTVQAAERFAAVDDAKGTDDRVRAENALAWVARFPNARSRAALLRAARKADEGGPFLECALALPKAFAGAGSRAEALAVIDRLLTLQSLGTSIEARLALAAAALDPLPDKQIAYARRAVATAREENIRRAALAALGERLCMTPETATEGLGLLADAVRLNPSAEEAPAIQLNIAETLQRLGKTDEALKAYGRYLESYNVPAFRVRVRQGKGRALLVAGRPDEALAAFSEAADLAQERTLKTDLTLEAAEAAVTAKRYSRAASLYRTLLREGRQPAIQLRLARCLEAAGETAEARRAYAEVRDDPAAEEADAFVAVMRLGAMLAEEDRRQETIAEYTRFLGQTKDPARRDALRIERGRAYHGLGQLAKAKDDFAAVSETSEPALAAEARFFLVLCLYGLGEDEQARELAQAYVTAYPDSERIPDVVLWLAKSDFNRGEYAAARKGFEDFASRWPKDSRVPQALSLAARAAYQDQEYAAVVELIGRMAKDFPQSEALADARFLQSEALMELARHGEARDLLDALIRRHPNALWIGEAYGRKGDCLFTTATDDPGRYELALEAYREALTRLENDPDASLMYLFKVGRTLEKQNRRNDAAEQYAKLIYRVLNRPEIYTDGGLRWLQKAIAQLQSIELARGNRTGFETLLRRIRRAKIPGITLPEI